MVGMTRKAKDEVCAKSSGKNADTITPKYLSDWLTNEAVQLKKFQKTANNSDQVSPLISYQQIADNSPQINTFSI